MASSPASAARTATPGSAGTGAGAATVSGASARQAAGNGAAASCFGRGIGDMAVRADAARATLLLMMVRSDGAVLGTGSGFAVRDSGTPADPRNRVVTATHVAAGAGSFEALGDRLHDMRLSRDAAVRPRRGSHLIAFTSEGTLLGSLDPVVSASASIRGADGGLRDPDTTVLSLRPSSAHAAAVYAAIGGLQLARQWPGIIRGQFGGAGSPGAGTGQSGGPFVGSDGLVYRIGAGKPSPFRGMG